MKVLGVVAVGVLSGAAGAWFVQTVMTPAPTVAVANHPETSLAPPPPPGWDRRLLSRVSALEARVSDMTTRAADEPEVQREPPDEREAARQQQYQEELTAHATALAEHAREPMNEPWADQQTTRVRAAIQNVAEHDSFELANVECRSKTCIASVDYPTPDEALMRHAGLATLAIEGCSGSSSTLEPPTQAGPYRARVVFYCR